MGEGRAENKRTCLGKGQRWPVVSHRVGDEESLLILGRVKFSGCFGARGWSSCWLASFCGDLTAKQGQLEGPLSPDPLMSKWTQNSPRALSVEFLYETCSLTTVKDHTYTHATTHIHKHRHIDIYAIIHTHIHATCKEELRTHSWCICWLSP